MLNIPDKGEMTIICLALLCMMLIRVIIKTLWARVIGVALCLILTPIALFSWGEFTRGKLFAEYIESFGDSRIPGVTGTWATKSILNSNEEIVCVMDSYGFAQDLPALNSNQRASIPKSILPSESGAWYLLFFSSDRVERIMLGTDENSGIIQVKSGCGDRNSVFVVFDHAADDSKILRSIYFQ